MIELVLRLGLSLGIVLGLFWAIARTGSKRMGGSRSLMKVRSRQSLSRSSSVAVVEVGSRVLVVGVSDGGVALLTELDPAEVAETAPAAQAVASTAPGRRAARTPLAARPLRLRPAMRSTGGKRRAGVPVTSPARELVETEAPAVPAAPLPDFATVLAAAQAEQPPVRPVAPAPAPTPTATLPDRLVAAMPAALVVAAEAELAAVRPATHVATQVAPAPDSSPLAGSVLAPGTWKSAWAALSSRSARPVASQGRS
ncbi:MAG TPA: flagellar biosynthetic protein FliO [Nocardioides sp.]|nr:flagellar biosynthetic protein FliO [Nocardioides sp.]